MNRHGRARECATRLILPPAALALGIFLVSLLGSGMLAPPPAQAQLTSPGMTTAPPPRVRVFLDCQARNCDSNHFRTEIPWVNWVRDRADADLHVIFTSTSVGGGGNRYIFDFIGLRGMASMTDQLTYTSAGSDVRTELMDGLTRAFSLGLVRYAVESGQGNNFDLRFLGPATPPTPNGEIDGENGEELHDPWNSWTFRFGLSGNMDIQERRSEQRLNPSLSANRVTEDWKMDASFWSNLRRQRIELADGREIRNDTDSWRVGGLVVRSITDHVSVGFDASARNAITQNQRARMSVRPAVEWNYFPYAMANRRQFIAHYGVGVEYSDYYETTVFGATQETLPTHRFAFQYRVREAWGNAGVGFDSSQYLHDASLYSFGLNGEISYRISRGLDLNLSADASRVNDQIHVAASNFSDEDILLGRVNLPTGYRYQASVGVGYRWGSTLANVVNNRFPGSVR
jgi:hypothetical protein